MEIPHTTADTKAAGPARRTCRRILEGGGKRPGSRRRRRSGVSEFHSGWASVAVSRSVRGKVARSRTIAPWALVREARTCHDADRFRPAQTYAATRATRNRSDRFLSAARLPLGTDVFTGFALRNREAVRSDRRAA